MTLYDEYRREHPVAAEPSEFREIIEAEVKRALEWMRGRDKPPLPDSVSDWAEADFKRANDLMAPLFDKIVEYESLHYPIDEPSREEAEAFRRKQEEDLPAKNIKPGRYKMMTEVLVETCFHAEIGCGMKCRGLVYGFPNASVNRCLESLVNGDATFQAVEG
jgi:hypothetical protein